MILILSQNFVPVLPSVSVLLLISELFFHNQLYGFDFGSQTLHIFTHVFNFIYHKVSISWGFYVMLREGSFSFRRGQIFNIYIYIYISYVTIVFVFMTGLFFDVIGILSIVLFNFKLFVVNRFGLLRVS